MAVESLSPIRLPEAGARERPVRISLLRGFSVERDGVEVAFPHVAQRLLAFLALADRPQLRARAAGVLWPDVPDRRAAASLRSTLWRIGRTGCQLVAATRDSLHLVDGVEVDVHAATAFARRLLASAEGDRVPGPGGRLLEGDLLPDWDDEWVLPERERFRQIRMHALERLAISLAMAGRPAEAVEAGLAAVAAEPLRESANRALIRVYLAEGNTVEARRQFDAYRRAVLRELRAEPSEDLRILVAGPQR